MLNNLFDESADVRLTPEGGLAIQLLNVTGSNVLKGSLLSSSPGTSDLSFVLCSSQYDGIGTAYEFIPATKRGWVTISGVADFLLQNGTSAVRGDWIRASTVEGRCTPNSPPAGLGAITADEHFKEIGHCLETKAGAADVFVKGIIRFN